MNKKRVLAISIVFLLCFSFINNVVVSNAAAQEDETSDLPDKPETLLQRLGSLISKLSPIIQFIVVAGASQPSSIEIGYNETVTVEVGLWDLENNVFEVIKEDEMARQYEEARYLKFEVVEYPGGNEFGKWKIDFNPIELERQVDVPLKTNVSISLRSPRLPDKPITSGVLKIKIIDKYVFGNIRWPKEGSPFDAPLKRVMWFALGVIGRWGQFSGQVLREELFVDILVKVKPYHAVNFKAVQYYQFKPDEIASIPITLQNLGNYNDTFSFKIISEHDNTKISEPISITLQPGETHDTYLGVKFAPSVFDYGTLHNIKIETYSIDEPNVTIATENVVLESRGVYVSEMGAFSSVLFLTFFIVVIAFVIILQRRKKDKICAKPDKPWELSEEKKYLEDIKEKNPEKFKEVRSMMNDEYKSSLLWYENYVYSIRHPKKIKKEKPKPPKPAKVKKQEEKPKEIESEPKKVKKEKIEPEKIKPIVDKKSISDDREKQKALKKIKKSQKKQMKKLRKLTPDKGGQ